MRNKKTDDKNIYFLINIQYTSDSKVIANVGSSNHIHSAPNPLLYT